MTITEILEPRSTVLVDERDTSLRATWHADDRVVVFSHWRAGVCRSTFHLANGDVARLTSFLVSVLGDAATGSPGRTPVQRGPRLLDRLQGRLAALRQRDPRRG